MKKKDEEVWKAVLSIDLQPVYERLLNSGSEKGSGAFGVRDYREFLYLLATHPDETIVPTKLIDLYWHEHIRDTRKYAADCKAVLASVAGRDFIHHDPRVVPGTDRFTQGVENRNRLFDEHFGHAPVAISADEEVWCDGESCA